MKSVDHVCGVESDIPDVHDLNAADLVVTVPVDLYGTEVLSEVNGRPGEGAIHGTLVIDSHVSHGIRRKTSPQHDPCGHRVNERTV